MNEKQTETKWYETLTVKMILLGGMTIMFLIPLMLIRLMINERESYSNDVKNEISGQWGGEQTISGPVLNIPVFRVSVGDDGKSRTERGVWHLLPENLLIEGTIDPEVRYKGIYETVIYDSDLKISGEFSLPEGRTDDYTVLWREAYFTFGVSDNRGLRDTIVLVIGGIRVGAEPGVKDQHLFQKGITFQAGFVIPGESYEFDVDLGLRGSGGIYFSPMGQTTTVNISSGWDAPSFKGSFLPVERVVNDNGFSSTWQVTHLNRNFPQEWIGYREGIEADSFGVDLLMEVDHYTKSERSAKYGILFIAFTFMILLFLEITSERKIHIFSYFLVALALVLFFSLLNSLSEHIGFNPAYLISTISTVALVTLFTGSIMEGRKTILTVSGMLTLLYAFLFVLLALKELSYLAGNIGLFIALAVIMRLSAKTNLFNKSSI